MPTTSSGWGSKSKNSLLSLLGVCLSMCRCLSTAESLPNAQQAGMAGLQTAKGSVQHSLLLVRHHNSHNVALQAVPVHPKINDLHIFLLLSCD